MSKQFDEEAMKSELSGSAFFKQPNQPASQLVSPPAGGPVGRSAAETTGQPAKPQTSKPSSPTAGQPSSWAPPQRNDRQLEEHAYDIFPDQARWLSRVQLELAERGTKANRYEIVQVAIDWLRQDYETKGETSQLLTELLKGPVAANTNMEKLADSLAFRALQNIVLEGFDPVSAGGFTQVPNILLNDTALSANAKLAYAKLLSYAWTRNYVYPGQERMAKDIGSSQSTVARAIHELQAQGWLEVTRRGLGRTNVYTLKHRVTKKRG